MKLYTIHGSLLKWLNPLRHKIQSLQEARELADLVHQPTRRIIVGAGSTRYNGWVATSLASLDLLNEASWRKHLPIESLDAILAEHVWEHLDPDSAVLAARTCFKFLKPGGYLRAAVPDGLHPDPNYISQVEPGGTGAGAHDHKCLYTHQSFQEVFASAGFEVRLLEYFDHSGAFHFEAWDPGMGMIMRSKRFDHRNALGTLSYTSIILDAVRPVG